MKRLQIAICDDSLTELETIKTQCILTLQECKVDFDISTFNSGANLLKSNECYDLALLDVEMENMNGIEIKNIIEQKYKHTKIIFVSNYQDKVLNAFGRNVFAYVDKSRLSNLNHILKKIIKDLLDNEILLLDKNFVLIKDIYYLEAEGAYTNVYLPDKTILLRKHLKEFEKKLEIYGFCRIHKSFIINFRYMKNISNTDVELVNGLRIKISRGAQKRIKEEHYKFIKEILLWK